MFTSKENWGKKTKNMIRKIMLSIPVESNKNIKIVNTDSALCFEQHCCALRSFDTAIRIVPVLSHVILPFCKPRWSNIRSRTKGKSVWVEKLQRFPRQLARRKIRKTRRFICSFQLPVDRQTDGRTDR